MSPTQALEFIEKLFMTGEGNPDDLPEAIKVLKVALKAKKENFDLNELFELYDKHKQKYVFTKDFLKAVQDNYVKKN